MNYSCSAGKVSIRRHSPEIILYGLPAQNMEFGANIRELRTHSSAKLIVLMSSCHEYLIHLLGQLDCHGLIYDAETSLDQLGEMIHHIRQGQHVVSPLLQKCQYEMRTNPVAFQKLLTDREQQVLSCITLSMSDTEIARYFGVAESTSLSHRKQIMGKLGIHSTPKLIRYGLEKGFHLAPPLHASA